MVNGISFKEVIEIIDKVDANGNALPFDIEVRTLQRNSKTGGRLLVYKGVKKYRPNKTAPTKTQLLNDANSLTKIKRNPNHNKNRTRLLELQNGDKRKIHIRLIVKVNGLKMYY